MESILGSEKRMQKVLLNVFRLSVLLPIIIILFQLYQKRKAMRDSLKNFPTIKLRIFNLLGHMIYLKNIYLFEYPAPFTAYHSILMTGLAEAYGKDGLILLWQALSPGVLLFRAEAAEMILSHSTELKKAWFYKCLRPWLGDSLLMSDGGKWRQRRKLLTSAFHFNILRDFLPVFTKQSKILISILKDHTKCKSVDIVPLIATCSFDTICETILGEEMHSQKNHDCEYLKSVATITEVCSHRILKPWLWPDCLFYLSPSGRLMRYHTKKAKAFTNEIIARKKEEKLQMRSKSQETSNVSNDDEDINDTRKRRALLDLLLDEHIDNDSISLQDIREEVDTFTFEGHDTTSMGMSWAIFLIGHHQDVQNKIHEELDSIFGDNDRDPTMDDLRNLKYLECVLKESLRLYPSVPGYGRQLQEDIEFKGHKIPKGCTCFVWIYALHRDPEVFPNPELFDPNRFTPENSSGRHPFAYVPFSAGPRNCIGQKFAMLEMKSVLSAIFRKYTVRSLQPRDLVHDTFEVVLRPHGGLHLEIRHRKSNPTL